MSLRERQKARRAREILDAAASLFERRGYANTTIEDIAEYAFVTPSTVYNYFGTKDGLLRGIVQTHIVERRAERQKFFDNIPQDLNIAINRYLGLLLDRAFVLVNREIWRQVLASGISNGGDRSDLLEEVTGALVDQFELFFQKFKERGIFKADTDLRDLAEAAMGISDFHFYKFVCHDTMTVEHAKAKIRTQLQLLFSGVLAQ